MPNLLRTAEPGLLGSEPGNLEPGGTGLLVAGTVPKSETYSLIAHLYTQGGAFKKLLGKLLTVPTISAQLNGGQAPVTLDLPAADTSANRPVQGDLVKLTQGGGPDGAIIYTGIIEDMPDDLDLTMRHGIDLAPLVAELDLAPITVNYTVNTDVAQMVRDAVSATTHLFVTPDSCPNSGVVGQANFNQVTALSVIDQARKIGGVNFYYFVDEIGCVWFDQANTAAPARYTVKRGIDYQSRKYKSPIAKLKNHIPVNGGIAPGTSAPAFSLYHNATSIAQYGIRALFPGPTFPNIDDQATLDAISACLGGGLDRRITRVELDINGFGTRIQLKRGATLRYFEPDHSTDPESEAGTGAYSPTYVVLEVHQYGPAQKVVVSDIPVAGVDDFQSEIDRIMERTSLANLSYVPAALNVVGKINGGGMQTSGPGTARWIIDGSSIRAEDGSGIDRGGGTNVTAKLGADGSFFASNILLQTALSGARMRLDASVPIEQIIDSSGVVRAEFGNLGTNGISAAGYKMRANDASGNPVFDSDGLIGVMANLATFTNAALANAPTGASNVATFQDVSGLVTSSYTLARPASVLVLAMTSIRTTASIGASQDVRTRLMTNGVGGMASMVYGTNAVNFGIMFFQYITLPAGTYSTKIQSATDGSNVVGYILTGIQVFLLGG